MNIQIRQKNFSILGPAEVEKRQYNPVPEWFLSSAIVSKLTVMVDVYNGGPELLR